MSKRRYPYTPPRDVAARQQSVAAASASVRASSEAAVVADTVIAVEGLGETLAEVQALVDTANETLATVNTTLSGHELRLQNLEAL